MIRMLVLGRHSDGSIEFYYQDGEFYYVDLKGRKYKGYVKRVTKKYVIVVFETERYRSRVYFDRKYLEKHGFRA